MRTLSTQRPNLKPAERSVPTRRNPALACRPIDAAFALSPMTAIDLAVAERFAAPHELVEERPADAAPLRVGADVYRIFERVAVGRARAVEGAVGVTGDPAAEVGDQLRQAAAGDLVVAPAQLGAPTAAPPRTRRGPCRRGGRRSRGSRRCRPASPAAPAPAHRE